jgi:hypothetical protein
VPGAIPSTLDASLAGRVAYKRLAPIRKPLEHLATHSGINDAAGFRRSVSDIRASRRVGGIGQGKKFSDLTQMGGEGSDRVGYADLAERRLLGNGAAT